MKVVTLYYPGDGTKGSNSATYKNATVVDAGPNGITFTTVEDGEISFAGQYRVKDKERAAAAPRNAPAAAPAGRARW
jgi:hypothetical protein